MDTLHRLILGLALALAHIGGWQAVGAPAMAQACACTLSGSVCSCLNCVCHATPEPSEPAPDQEEASRSPETPRVPGPDRVGLGAWACDAPPPSDAGALITSAHAWTGTDPFAFWCVWRT